MIRYPCSNRQDAEGFSPLDPRPKLSASDATAPSTPRSLPARHPSSVRSASSSNQLFDRQLQTNSTKLQFLQPVVGFDHRPSCCGYVLVCDRQIVQSCVVKIGDLCGIQSRLKTIKEIPNLLQIVASQIQAYIWWHTFIVTA